MLPGRSRGGALPEPQRQATTKQSGKDLPAQISELWELVLAYAKQETLEPMKALGRYVAFGVAGGICISIGAVLVAVGGLRAIQTEEVVVRSHLRDNWDWVPYLVVVLFSAVVAVLALSRIGKVPKGRTR
jgi:choline-glycine betaine transporter